MSNLFNLMKESRAKELDPILADYAKSLNLTLGSETDEAAGKISRSDLADRLGDVQEYVYAQFTGRDFEGKEYEVPSLDMTEAMTTSDVSIIFPRVISEVLQEPKEPNLFLSNVIAEVVELPDSAPLTIEFPRVAALNAYEGAEGQDYRNENMAFTQDTTAIRIKKIMCSTAVTEEVQAHSLWPILKLSLRMISAAIDRKVESNLFNAMTGRAQVVFDNNNANTVYQTAGRGQTQAWNATLAFDDLVKMMGVLLGNRYNGTHFLAHPLAWPILAQNPILRSALATDGQLGSGIWSRAPQFDQQAAIPFGLMYVPYYAIPYTEQGTLTGAGSGLGAALITDLYVIDQKNSLFLAQRGKTDLDRYENWFRDATQVKGRKYAGVAVKDTGKGMVVAKNIRVALDFSPVFTVRTTTS